MSETKTLQVWIEEPYILCIGHVDRGDDEPGANLGCEAVGAITQTLIRSLMTLTEWDRNYGLQNGYFRINLDGLDDGQRLLCRAWLAGMKMLAEAYPSIVIHENAEI